MGKVTMLSHNVKATLFKSHELPADYKNVCIADPMFPYNFYVCVGRTDTHPAHEVSKVLVEYLKNSELGLRRVYGSHNVYTRTRAGEKM